MMVGPSLAINGREFDKYTSEVAIIDSRISIRDNAYLDFVGYEAGAIINEPKLEWSWI